MNPSVDDLERQAVEASLKGADDLTESLWTRAHNESLQGGDAIRAGRCIYWLVLDLFNRREWARGNGWLARGLHMLEPEGDSPSLGLLLVLAARNHLRLGEVDAAAEASRRAVELANQFNDPDLNVFSRMALALVQTRRGEAQAAASLFD